MLAIPLSGEQNLVAENVVRLGAGVRVFAHEYRNAVANLQLILNDNRYVTSAQTFAKKYVDMHHKHHVQRVLEILETIANEGGT